jgi:hypothetical protein
MANWDNSANNQMAAVKAATNATDAQMATLLQQISGWANANPNGSTHFPFGNYPNHAVNVVTSGGWIKSVSYGT